ncbi:MAG: ATP synthase F1 subunit gamma [Ignavibacteriales bacterium]|nr:ATP synthase F1 subunit gamma [Ignavibacteriales bacterium]
MATLREIRRRIGSVKNTQKITKAMKMVAAAKLRRAQEAIVAARPYARKMREVLSHLLEHSDDPSHPLAAVREVHRVAIVIVTADRGLCGAFNANVQKAAVEYVRKTYSHLLDQKHGVRFVAVGRKGFDFLNKRNNEVFSKHIGIFQALSYAQAKSITNELAEGFLTGEFDRVDVIYNEFKSVIQQRVAIEQLLPVPVITSEASALSRRADFIYEPSSAAIVNDLLPRHLNFQMWRILLESNAAEQGAKMTAMSNATENAKELISSLTLSYNKARQAGITKELLEIVAGAEALKKAG